jgi:hypothetical protein
MNDTVRLMSYIQHNSETFNQATAIRDANTTLEQMRKEAQETWEVEYPSADWDVIAAKIFGWNHMDDIG